VSDDDLDQHIGLFGLGLFFVVQLLPPVLGVAVPAGLQSSKADGLEYFIQVLLFTLPLSLGIAVWGIAVGRVPELRQGAGLLVFSVICATGFGLLAFFLGHLERVPTGTSLPGQIVAVLQEFLTAYGLITFAAAVAVGLFGIWLWFKHVEPDLPMWWR
jgi:hypothetical protein